MVRNSPVLLLSNIIMKWQITKGILGTFEKGGSWKTMKLNSMMSGRKNKWGGEGEQVSIIILLLLLLLLLMNNKSDRKLK